MTSPEATKRIAGRLGVFHHVHWEHLAAGVGGGVLSTLVLHPLDLIKVRFQVNEGVAVTAQRPQYLGISHALRTIYRNEGVRGLYLGVTPNVWGAGASWGLYFLFYNSTKRWMQDGDESRALSAGKHMLAACLAGVVSLSITNPIWVAKTRMCLQYDHYNKTAALPAAASTAPSIYYRSMTDCLVKTYSMEGIRGLYKGFVPGLFGVSHGALQFMAYEELKKVYNQYRHRNSNTKLNSLEYILFAALSKIFAATVTYPYQVLRARLQDQHTQYGSVREVTMQIIRHEGYRGFFKGVSPYLLHVTPNICIVFLVYEQVINMDYFKKHRAPQLINSLSSHNVLEEDTNLVKKNLTHS